MPMNPRLLRPTQGGFSSPDADARAYLAAVRIADGSNLEPAVAKAISDFVIGCKADGIWSSLKAACILMGAKTLSGALTPLVGAAPVNNNFVSGDYNRKTGLVGNSSNKYIDTSRADNADGQNDAHLAFHVTTAAAVFRMYGGVGGNNYVYREDPLLYFLLRGGNGTASAASATGFIGQARSSSTEYTFRVSGATTTQATNSTAANAGNVYIFGRNVSNAINSPSSARMTFYSQGSALTLATLDTRVSNLYTAIGAAI
jgi:hypothetical protein